MRNALYTLAMLVKRMNLSLIFLAMPFFALASTSSGTIDPTYHSAMVCDGAGCTATTNNLINFLPTTGSGVTPITIDDTNGIDGDAWGNNLGWISFGRTGTSTVTINPTTGVISGYAWSQVSGWINMSPTGYGVSIDTNGQFTGYAWASGTNGGWIKFDCTGGASTCVKTDWRPTSARIVTPSGGGGGGGGGGSIVPTGTNTTTTTNSGTITTQSGPQNQKNGDYTNLYRADIEDSGFIDILDFNTLLVNWGKPISLDTKLEKKNRCTATNIADINCDGKIDVLDFNLILIYWNQYVGPQGDLLKAKLAK